MQYVADALIRRESLGKCLILVYFFFLIYFILKKLKLNTKITNLTSENKETHYRDRGAGGGGKGGGGASAPRIVLEKDFLN